MNITIFSSGYVGLVTAACFADVGNDVLCVDIDAGRVAPPVPGPDPDLRAGPDRAGADNAAEGRLRFATDAAEGAAARATDPRLLFLLDPSSVWTTLDIAEELSFNRPHLVPQQPFS